MLVLIFTDQSDYTQYDSTVSYLQMEMNGLITASNKIINFAHAAEKILI